MVKRIAHMDLGPGDFFYFAQAYALPKPYVWEVLQTWDRTTARTSDDIPTQEAGLLVAPWASTTSLPPDEHDIKNLRDLGRRIYMLAIRGDTADGRVFQRTSPSPRAARAKWPGGKTEYTKASTHPINIRTGDLFRSENGLIWETTSSYQDPEPKFNAKAMFGNPNPTTTMAQREVEPLYIINVPSITGEPLLDPASWEFPTW